MTPDNILSKDHISYLAVDSIKKIAQPLAKLGDVHYFCYGVNYPDTSGFTLHTSSDYYETWFENQFPLCGFHLDEGWHLWESTLPEKQLNIAESFNYGQGVFFVLHHKDKTEIFSFGSRPGNTKAIDFYLNNQNLLKRFSTYFRENAKELIGIADQQLIKPPPGMVKRPESPSKYNLLDNPTIENFLHDLSYPFNVLSERECECYKLILKGYSIAQMGIELNLAIPTVAVYISRIKQKLKCKSKSELINIAQEAKLIEYYL
ncbi:MAG: response regulator transcription factor [Candidatus Berkiella sp.]